MEETIETVENIAVKNEIKEEKIEAPKKKGRPKKETQETSDGRILIYMQYGAGWTTPSNIDFSDDTPYQLVPAGEAESLLKESRFRKASAEEVKVFYSING